LLLFEPADVVVPVPLSIYVLLWRLLIVSLCIWFNVVIRCNRSPTSLISHFLKLFIVEIEVGKLIETLEVRDASEPGFRFVFFKSKFLLLVQSQILLCDLFKLVSSNDKERRYHNSFYLLLVTFLFHKPFRYFVINLS
jgi:hypothetical protein